MRVVGVERQADVVANFLGDAEVGRIVGTDTVRIQDVGRITLDHQVAKIVIQGGIVVLGPKECLRKWYLFIGLVPCRVVFGIYGNELVFRRAVVCCACIFAPIVKHDATHRTIQFTNGLMIVVERCFNAQGNDESYLWNMRRDSRVEVQRFRYGAVGY